MRLNMRKHLGMILMTVLIGLASGSLFAEAVTVPTITIDPECVYVPLGEFVKVKGTLSMAKGQKLVLYAKDGKAVLAEEKVENTGGAVYFSITVPTKYTNSPGKTTVYVRSLQAKGVTASKAVRVTIHSGLEQTIKAPSKITLTDQKKTYQLKKTSDAGNKLYFKSSAPGVVTVNENGKLTRKKNGTATITIRQPGNDHYLPATEKVKVISQKNTY